MLNYDSDSFKSTLKSLGISKGDKLFIHSSLPALGRVQDVSKVITAILETINHDGIVVMPAYTYNNWPDTGYFNPQTTKAETGVISNEFINYSDAVRTIQGNHSVTVWGDSNEDIINNWVSSSFSKESSIYRTLEQNFKNVMIGTNFSTGCSIFHCIEQELEVPYRFNKKFPGTVETSEDKVEFEFEMFVRDLDYNVDLNRVIPLLEGKSDVKSSKYNYGLIQVFPIQWAYDIVKQAIKNDPYYLAEKTSAK